MATRTADTGAEAGLGVRLWRLFSYVTIESNLIVLAAGFKALDGKLPRR